MADWHCFKCKEQMTKAEKETLYMEFDGNVEVLECPKCKAYYMTEETVIDDVVPGEEAIESK